MQVRTYKWYEERGYLHMLEAHGWTKSIKRDPDAEQAQLVANGNHADASGTAHTTMSTRDAHDELVEMYVRYIWHVPVDRVPSEEAQVRTTSWNTLLCGQSPQVLVAWHPPQRVTCGHCNVLWTAY